MRRYLFLLAAALALAGAVCACTFTGGRAEDRPLTAEELEGLTQREFRQKYGDRAFAWRGVVPLRRNLALLSQEKDSL